MKPLKRVVIKEELVELTGGFIPAIILNQFLYWSERMFDTDKYIREEKVRAEKFDVNVSIDESNGWIYKTSAELNEELMIGISVSTMRKYIKQLVEAGFILERKNPKYKWDKTMQYRVNLYKVQLELGKLGYVLEGYKLLPNIKISEEVEEEKKEIEEVEVLEENKKVVPAPTDTTDNKTDKKFKDDSIICEDDKNMQEENIDLEEIALNRLRETYPNFDLENEKLKTIMIKNEILKVKERIELDKYKKGHKDEYWKW